MVFCAFQVQQHVVLIGTGATLFLCSDFILALTLFVGIEHIVISILIMFLYYTAQLLLVLGITNGDNIKAQLKIYLILILTKNGYLINNRTDFFLDII